MKIEQQQVGTVDVFAPVGPLVEKDGEDFSSLLLQRVRSSNARVVVAMHGVPYMDSVAVEGLLDATDGLSDRATSLKIVEMTSTCREILELTGVAERFQFFEDVQDAVRSFL